MSNLVEDAFFGAKIFYFSCTSIIFLIICLYDNPFRNSILNFELIPTPFLFITSLILSSYYFLTTGNNPGYAFKNTNDIENNLENNKINDKKILLENVENSTENKDIKTSTEKENNHFCDFCNIKQEFRMKHCKKCERCVHKFDHHCFWVGGCVGELNHGKFWLFLLSQTITNIFAFVFTWYGLDNYEYSKIIKDDKGNNEKIYSSEYGAFVIACMISFGFVIFTAILLFYHTYLLSTGQTTWEHSRRNSIDYLRNYPPNIYPFDMGFKDNFKMAIFHKNLLYKWVPKDMDAILNERNKSFNWCDNKYYSCC